ncbi:MAG: class I SAM-dependent RNA methyltransferase [Hyphomicrobiales bacterium]|nr:class I SAM-dependent RNA methyltransferase [Hyphomicrobiales bacterium]MBV8823494.1 class I SAM-dependent RNA methyltransferase [Hyphomicrobiales bacterium]MBV9426595.1 class I SAM-dependent RNA methyltransferase [Bradyrhizobiaceae bacterium]
MVERLVIDRLGHRGDGIADTPDGPLYVPYVLPGETVEVERVPGHADRRHALRVEVESAERIAPICPHFGVCGGCALQHWDTVHYRAWKRGLVVAALAQAGLDAHVEQLIDAHGAGRRRAVFHARRSHDVLQVGFAAYRAHHIVPIDRCPVLAPELLGAIKAAWALAEALRPQRKPLDIHVTASEPGLDVDIRGSGPLTPDVGARLAQLARPHRLARLTRHGELIAQHAQPTLRIGRARVALPPGAFLQATAEGEAVLARLVAGHVGHANTVADLFAGVGPFALRLAERSRVHAVDNDAAAIAGLRQAAGVPGIKPIETQVRDLFRRPLIAAELAPFDAVVFDPPRQGAQAQARALAESKVPVVVAVSCNPATFARDARLLVDGGYRLVAATPVDQFRYSAHVEIVAHFAR